MSQSKGPSDLVRYSHLGIQFALIILGSLWLGNRLDRKLGTGSFLALAGMFLGAGIGFYVLYRETQRSRGADPGDSHGHGPGDGRDPRDSDGPRGGS